jgi:rare lipoprotein A
MLRLAGLVVGTFLLAFAIVALGVVGGYAKGLNCPKGLTAASWYGKETCRYNPDPRCPTASGILHFDGSQLIVAHRTWPFHTRVRLTFNGRSIVVPVEDRGPAKWTGKDIDLSHATAKAIGLKGIGCLKVERL